MRGVSSFYIILLSLLFVGSESRGISNNINNHRAFTRSTTTSGSDISTTTELVTHAARRELGDTGGAPAAAAVFFPKIFFRLGFFADAPAVGPPPDSDLESFICQFNLMLINDVIPNTDNPSCTYIQAKEISLSPYRPTREYPLEVELYVDGYEINPDDGAQVPLTEEQLQGILAYFEFLFPMKPFIKDYIWQSGGVFNEVQNMGILGQSAPIRDGQKFHEANCPANPPPPTECSPGGGGGGDSPHTLPIGTTRSGSPFGAPPLANGGGDNPDNPQNENAYPTFDLYFRFLGQQVIEPDRIEIMALSCQLDLMLLEVVTPQFENGDCLYLKIDKIDWEFDQHGMIDPDLYLGYQLKVTISINGHTVDGSVLDQAAVEETFLNSMTIDTPSFITNYVVPVGGTFVHVYEVEYSTKMETQTVSMVSTPEECPKNPPEKKECIGPYSNTGDNGMPGMPDFGSRAGNPDFGGLPPANGGSSHGPPNNPIFSQRKSQKGGGTMRDSVTRKGGTGRDRNDDTGSGGGLAWWHIVNILLFIILVVSCCWCWCFVYYFFRETQTIQPKSKKLDDDPPEKFVYEPYEPPQKPQQQDPPASTKQLVMFSMVKNIMKEDGKEVVSKMKDFVSSKFSAIKKNRKKREKPMDVNEIWDILHNLEEEATDNVVEHDGEDESDSFLNDYRADPVESVTNSTHLSTTMLSTESSNFMYGNNSYWHTQEDISLLEDDFKDPEGFKKSGSGSSGDGRDRFCQEPPAANNNDGLDHDASMMNVPSYIIAADSSSSSRQRMMEPRSSAPREPTGNRRGCY